DQLFVGRLQFLFGGLELLVDGPAPGRAGGAGCFIPGGNGGGSGFLGSFSFLSSIGIRLKIVFAPLYSTFSQFPFS
ncbi:MAG TPA: hypothetical protein DDW67_06375, partial [Elusimicrobia bacterium]|nr:hypothetical protein [Elusimicrobiota bacterium]